MIDLYEPARTITRSVFPGLVLPVVKAHVVRLLLHRSLINPTSTFVLGKSMSTNDVLVFLDCSVNDSRLAPVDPHFR